MNNQLTELQQNLNRATDQVLEASCHTTLDRLDVLTDELIQVSMGMRIALRKAEGTITR